MVEESSPVYQEILLLETSIECGLLNPKGKWKSIIAKISNYVEKLEERVKELEDPNTKLDQFVMPDAREKE